MRDVAEVRALAEAGMTRMATARLTGISEETINVWQHRFGLVFSVAAVHRPPHPALADLAVARLMATMQRLREYAGK